MTEEETIKWARGRILDADLKLSEIRALCDLLNGTIHTAGLAHGEEISADMIDAELDGILKKWGIDRVRWHDLADEIKRDEALARAVYLVAYDFWDTHEDHTFSWLQDAAGGDGQ